MIGALFDRLRDLRRRKIWTHDQALGRRGEDLVHRYLRKHGYTIVARNYRLSAGDAEADIIAREGDALVIIEVKTRETAEFGPPDRAIDPEKRRHLLRVAREYSRKTSTPIENIRVDVAAVILSNPPEITLYPGAIPLH
jgi:putative endonuclease